MKILMRVFALGFSVFTLCIWSVYGAAVFASGLDVRGAMSFLVVSALTILFFRVGMWLWSNRPFWKMRARAAEVATAGVALGILLVTAQLEQVVSRKWEALIHVLAVGLVVGALFAFRRFLPIAADESSRHQIPSNPVD